MHRLQLILATAVSGFLVVASLTAIFISIAPADVLKDWRITVAPAAYHPGSVVIVNSSSTKLRKASGDVHRAIECNVSKDNTVAYTVNDSSSARVPGYAASNSALVIPYNIANLPATCRVIITIDYRVYWFRHTNEYAASNDFQISAQ